jgi:2-keto-4-pentenoate hydratase/2-oxohepta-3-ene-1,7-dioic acid hydratase in catechol pathway
MKLVSFAVQGRRSFGMVVESGIMDLGRRLPGSSDLRAFLADAAQERAPPPFVKDYDLTEVEFLPVIPNPDKIICIGLNYKAHVDEVNRSVSARPPVFIRFASSQIGHLQPLVRPKVSHSFDFEGELAVVIGKACRRVPKAHALDFVAGYSCYNDGSIRDWQLHTHQWAPGKNFPGTGAFGPWLVTKDEIPDPNRLTLTTRLNGNVVQHSGTDLMIFPVAELIEYITQFTPLSPGDVIVTGTPGGTGHSRKPPLFMEPGGNAEVEISQIGCLRNPIEDERE